MKMSRFTKIVLLLLIGIVQMLTIIGGFFAYEQMSDMLWKSLGDYNELLWETGGRHIDYGLIPNPFAPLLSLVLLGLFLTIVLLVDEIRHKPELTTLEALE
jgi:uncharacterized protein YneF (UPF0154 family)